ncbi:hypothetical protein ACORG1_13350 [Mycobacterium sp. TJFP1]
MNPLHIPRTVLACVGVVIDTAVRMHCQNRDYEAAVRAAAPKSEREPVEAEAERPPYPAASATAALSPAIPPASDTDPVGVVDGPPASATPAGPPSHPFVSGNPGSVRSANSVKSGAEPGPLTELIAAVLTKHQPIPTDDPHWHDGPVGCGCQGLYWPDFIDWSGWHAHVAALIAERIEKATPPVQLTSADLCRAAHLVQCYAAIIDTTDHHHWDLISFADRLVAAANADPTP